MTWTNNEGGASEASASGAARLADVEGQPVLVERNRCLHQLIEAQARRTPDQVALVFEHHRLTYGELDQRANRLARHLRGLGVGPDGLVGLFVERSLEMVVGLLGILKAGAAYVPIDTAYPGERIAFMLTDAHVTLLLTQSHLVASLPDGAARAVCLDAFDWTHSAGPAPDEAQVEPEHLCYVIYTSGSTGRPKGVGVEHRNIVNYVLGVAERLRLEPGMTHATVSTIAADLGNTVIFPALATGGCLHVISKERAENPAMLADYFSREQIDVLKIVPSHLAALQTGKNPDRVLPRRRLILGGEASRLDWIEQLCAVAPTCEIYNHYGPTETTVGVLTYHVGRSLPRTPSGTLPLGRPLPNSHVYILDGSGQPVPVGDRGELHIGGAGVARGYLNRPELTAEKFIPDPFAPHPGERLYRTGDLVRYLPDGNIEFCGRIDDQVKLHGYRIELGEIEGVLREQPGVREAVVRACEDESRGTQLIAYVVPKRAQQALWGCPKLHVLPDGLPVAHLNKNETDYIYNEIFVLQAYLRHGITIRDGDCIVDAGANIGLFTVFASRLARDLRIMAFEPNPAAFACLKANAEAWGTGVQCFPLGLSRENGSAELTFFEGLSLLSGFYADAATEREVVKSYVFNQQSEALHDERLATEIGDLVDDRLRAKPVAAQLRTLSSVIAEKGIDRIDLLKVNVEKSELDVLLGLGPGDWPKIRQLVIEVDQRENLAPITALLQRHGFEVLVEQDPLLRTTELCYVYAIRPSATGPCLLRQQPADAHVRALSSGDGGILTPTTLRASLKQRLPQYMIPSAFVLMEKFPLTANGKIDRQALSTCAVATTQAAHDVARPRTETEKTLAAIWTDLLKVETIGINDNFFDLGGHSLLAIKAVSRIRDAFEVDLSLRNLFERPTLAALAEAIEALAWVAGASQQPDRRDLEFLRSAEALARQQRAIVPLQPRGERTPVFAVPGHNGDVFCFRALTRYLGDDQPFFGLQPPGLDGHSQPLESVEDLAAYFAAQVLAFRPEGPYVLAGYCAGGPIAFELARQLRQRGAAISFVALFGSPHPTWYRFLPRLGQRLAHQVERVSKHARALASLAHGDRRQYITERLRLLRARPAATRLAAPDPVLVRRAGVAAATLAALRRYNPQHFGGRVSLFWPNNEWLRSDGGRLHWWSVARHIEEYFGPDGCIRDRMLLEPYVRDIAELFRRCREEQQVGPGVNTQTIPSTPGIGSAG